MRHSTCQYQHLIQLGPIQEDNLLFIGDRSICKKRLAPFLMAAVLLVILVAAPGARAKLVKEKARSTPAGPETVFTAIAEAWENADEEALANLVHEDGLRVTNGEYDRFTNYSPSQAFYYFKNQFQLHPTVSFTFKRLQDSPRGQDRIHGMVIWEYRRAQVKQVQEMRLVLVLTRQDNVWRLSEINTITTR